MFANSHKKGIEYNDPILTRNSLARLRVDEIGIENVINGKVIADRAETFFENLNPEMITPNKKWFFIGIKSEIPLAEVEKLNTENIFMVPMKKGIRVAICSLEKQDLISVAETMKRIMQ